MQHDMSNYDSLPFCLSLGNKQLGETCVLVGLTPSGGLCTEGKGGNTAKGTVLHRVLAPTGNIFKKAISIITPINWK